MLKPELIDIVAAENDLKRSSAAALVNLFFDEMAETLKRGQKIDVRGFGIIEVKAYKAYQGRNPKTGEKVEVGVKRMPRWRTSGPLKKRMGATAKDEVEQEVETLELHRETLKDLEVVYEE